MALLPILVAISAVLFAIYYYFFRNLGFFEKHGIIHERPVPLFGNLMPFILRKMPLLDITKKTYNLHPEAKYVGFYDFSTPIIIIRDVELIKSITIKNFDHFVDHRNFVDPEQDPLFGHNLFSLRGDKWRDTRAILSPAFTSSKMKGMFTLMNTSAENFAEFLSKLPEDQKVLEAKDAFGRFTTDVIASCAFGISVDSMKNPKNEFFLCGKEISNNFNGFIQILKFYFSRNLPNYVNKYLGVRVFSKQVVTFFEETIKATMKMRTEQGIQRPDVIQLLMDDKNKEALSPLEMTAQAFVFFLGGFDTTSTFLSFTIYMFAIYPEVMKKLQNEIDECLHECNGQFTYEAVNRLEYLDAVLNEVQRVYPIGIFLDRVCTKDFELPPALPGAKPFTMKKGTYLQIPVAGLHSDPKYFENPEKFEPERFLRDGKKIMNSGAYIPFGIGPRICIGNRFAQLESKIMLCHLLARCDVKVSSKTSIPLKLSASGFTLMAKNGFWVKIEPRSNPHPLIKNHRANDTCKA